MTRRYGDPVDVRRRDDVPAEFVWRSRFYVVRAVLDHWIEVAPWWRSRPARSLYESGGSVPPSTPNSATTSDPPGAVLIDDGEREVWRVEARPGRDASPGVFDLVLDWSTGTWTLARTMD
jgi:Family of unknown function (DUF6504)